MLLLWLAVATFLGAALAAHPLERRITDVDDPIIRDDGVNYRLPNDTHPESYELALRTRVDTADFDYSGYVKIGIVVDRSTRSVVLHMRELTVVNVTLARYNGMDPTYELAILPYGYDLRTEFLNITTNGIDLVRGDRLLLEIHYWSSLATKPRGFYRSSYKNADDTQKWLAATYFKATNARSAFPCYDEPALKATFTIRITHGKSYHAISNMPEVREENLYDTATTMFTQTPMISTNSIAFVISDFAYKTNTNTTGVFRHRVYAQPAKIESTAHALNDGVRIQSALENYLQVNFSLSKIDQVAVPDMGVSVMENWGLVVFAEEALLWNPLTDARSDQYFVSGTIAHQFAHQWFGHLVSPQFWQYLWLNEGFANIFGYIGIDLVYPEWKMFHIYVANAMHNVLYYDARPSARAMTFHAQTPAAIERLFDVAMYQKSGSVLYMFMHAFTESSFKKGLRYYLTANAYKAVGESDLFDALEKAVKEDNTLDADYNVRDIFSSWSNQPGYPLIAVQRVYRGDNTSDAITLSQRRYMSDKTLDNDSATWWVPFNYATSKGPSFSDTRAAGWIRQNERSHSLNVSLSSSDWIVLNKQQSSLYRVLYDEHNYRLIANQLNSDKFGDIHVLSRSQLLHDLYEFVKVGRVKIDMLFDFLAYLSRETEYAPWRSAQPVLLWLELLLGGSEHFLSFRSFVAQLTQKYYESEGTEEVPGEAITKKFDRRRALFYTCRYRLPACSQDMRKKLVQSLQSGSTWSLDVAQYVYHYGMRTASETELELLWKRLFDTTNPDEARNIAGGFGWIEDTQVLQIYLNRTLQAYSKEPSYPHWRYAMLNYTLDNGPLSLRTTIRFIRYAASDFKKFFIGGDMAYLISVMALYNMYADTQIEFEDTLDYLVDGGHISRAVAAKAREDMKIHKNEFNKYKPSLDQWFASRKKSSSGTRLYSPALQYYSLAIVMLLLLVK